MLDRTIICEDGPITGSNVVHLFARSVDKGLRNE